MSLTKNLYQQEIEDRAREYEEQVDPIAEMQYYLEQYLIDINPIALKRDGTLQFTLNGSKTPIEIHLNDDQVDKLLNDVDNQTLNDMADYFGLSETKPNEG